MNADAFIYAVELVGTAAFASSGAMVAIRRNMDLVGVLALALTTAVGGGFIRDLVLGIHPPRMFENETYAAVALATALALFIVARRGSHVLSGRSIEQYERVMTFLDALGLGIFTVVGIEAAVSVGMGDKKFLCVFVGMTTGVGGGLIRDVLARQMPFILVKEIYACASLAGALLYVVCMNRVPEVPLVALATTTVVVIRMLAVHYNWNLPRALPREKKFD